MKDTYDPKPAYAHFKRIRNFIRKLDPATFIACAVGFNHKTYKGGRDEMIRNPPWNTLVLIKWCVEQWDDTAHRRPPASEADYVKAVNLMHDLENLLRLPSQYGHVSFFMRATAFRQFPLQGEPSLNALARQEKLFCGLEDNHRFRAEFLRVARVDYDIFTELGLGLIALMLAHPNKVYYEESDFAAMSQGISRSDVETFFRHISATLPDMKTWLQSQPFPKRKDGQRDINQEVMEPSPLFQKPLLHIQGRYYILHRILLVRALETIVHRTLRQSRANFPSEFGHVFEKHVAACMDDAGVRYVPEAVLQAHLPTCAEPKCVDFLISDGQENILIDAKGVEINERKRATFTSLDVASSVETSVLKGIRQALITLTRSRVMQGPAPFSVAPGKTFLVIVTYGDLNLGLSRDLEQMFQNQLHELKAEFGEPLPIPVENIFYLTAVDFELAMALVRNKRATLFELLKRAKARDADRSTAKFLFSMHLEEEARDLENIPMLPMMQKAVDELWGRCATRFADGAGAAVQI